jgi:hypothetical protein
MKSGQRSPFMGSSPCRSGVQVLPVLSCTEGAVSNQYRRQAALGTSWGYVALKLPLQTGLRVPAQAYHNQQENL